MHLLQPVSFFKTEPGSALIWLYVGVYVRTLEEYLEEDTSKWWHGKFMSDLFSSQFMHV